MLHYESCLSFTTLHKIGTHWHVCTSTSLIINICNEDSCQPQFDGMRLKRWWINILPAEPKMLFKKHMIFNWDTLHLHGVHWIYYLQWWAVNKGSTNISNYLISQMKWLFRMKSPNPPCYLLSDQMVDRIFLQSFLIFFFFLKISIPWPIISLDRTNMPCVCSPVSWILSFIKWSSGLISM